MIELLRGFVLVFIGMTGFFVRVGVLVDRRMGGVERVGL